MDLEEHLLADSSGEYSRRAWLFTTSQPRKICVFLDGEFYLHHLEGPSVLGKLQAEGLIPSVACLFVSQMNGLARHQDYTCNPRYARFIAEDVIRWIRDCVPSTSPGDHFIGGASLGGLEAAHTALLYPKIFTATLSQSGSFWWNKEWLKDHLESLLIARGRYWISVGNKEREAGVSHPPTGLRQEVPQVDAAENFAQSLLKKGATIHYHLYQGGHEFVPWREELPDALGWLLGNTPSLPKNGG